MRRFLFAILAVMVLGCEPLERAQQCRAIAAVVNPTLAEIEGPLTAEPRGWAAVENRLVVLGPKLSALRINEPKLNQVVADLATNFAAARQVVSLGTQSRSNGQNDDAAVAEWARVRDRHANIVRGLSRYCRHF